MPLTSVYDIGTVSVTTNTPDVVGVGTNWVGAGIREGDLLWIAGLTVRVLALVDNTHLTLAHNWPGATVSGSAYEIQYTADMSRVLAKSTDILESFDTTALNAIKGLTPANNRIAYFTGAATAALATLTPFIRTLLDDTNQTQAKATLGITNQANAMDATANALLAVGSFGLGSQNGNNITDINATTTPTSFCTVDPTTVAGTLPPTVGTKDGLLHIKIDSTIAVQVYFSAHSSSPVYYRRSTGSATWQAWKSFTFD